MHPDPSALLATAMAHHQAGRLDQAEAQYRVILAHDPNHADSLHLLGLATAQRGEPMGGAALIRRAMVLTPGQAPHHNSLAYAFRQLGRLDDAVSEYRDAIALRPASAEIHNNLATALTELGRHDEALLHYRQAAVHAPGVAAIWYNLANALTDRGPAAETEACFQRAIALDPDYADALANYGRWLMTRSRWAKAEALLTKATRIAPDRIAPWINLANTLSALGRFDAAELCCRTALACDPECSAAHYNLGCVLLGQGRTDEAADCQATAIAADPSNGIARLAFCVAQLPIIYHSEAEIAVRRQRYAGALKNLAATTRGPEQQRSLANAIGASQPFFLPYQGQNDRRLQDIYGRLACRVLQESLPPAVLAAPPTAGTRIRLGIVSGFICDHTLFKLFLEGWLTQLDRNRFELIAFHTGHTWDDCTARAAGWCDRFVHGLPLNQAWRQAIQDTAPHVLLYPEVGMDSVAAWLAAQRLAPVQCVAWGHPETTGMPTLDYFLSSEMMEPADSDAHYTERLVRLPNLGMWYRPDEPPALQLDRAAVGLRPDVPVYWSGQALYKYLPQFDPLYPRIAAAVGACQFVFIAFARSRTVTEAFRDRLHTAFAAAGMDADRYCVFLPPMPQAQFVAAVGLADVVLDTPGWSGGKSTLDCLSQDPAVVTWPGGFMRGRHTAAILRRIGCASTIANSQDEYVSIAARLGRDPAWRAEVRQAVRRGKGRVFMDPDYIRGLETFLKGAVTS